MLGRQVVGHHFRALALHVKCEKPARRANVQDTLAGKWNVAEVAANASAEIPLSVYQPVTRNVHGVIEGTLAHVGNQPRRGINRRVWHRFYLARAEDLPRRRAGSLSRLRELPTVYTATAPPNASGSDLSPAIARTVSAAIAPTLLLSNVLP